MNAWPVTMSNNTLEPGNHLTCCQSFKDLQSFGGQSCAMLYHVGVLHIFGSTFEACGSQVEGRQGQLICRTFGKQISLIREIFGWSCPLCPSNSNYQSNSGELNFVTCTQIREQAT